MLEIPFRVLFRLPVVTARISGEHGSAELNLVLDTGAAVTQIDTPIIDQLGYSAANAIKRVSAVGPAGPVQQGYELKVKRFEVLGHAYEGYRLATYDFDHFADEPIDGLLGFDVISKMRLEIDGPAKLLKVYGE